MDFTNHGPLLLISQFPAAAVRAAGPEELHRWLPAQHVRGATALAARANAAAAAQHVRIPGDDTAVPSRDCDGGPKSSGFAAEWPLPCRGLPIAREGRVVRLAGSTSA